jgi:ribosome-associated protein
MTQEATAKKDTQKLQRAIVDGLEDVKGQDIQVFNTEHLSPLFERVIVASGTSNRQTRALASSVIDAVREAGFPKPRIEGEENGEWIIVDCGAAVAHIMQPAIRQYYRLEEIWGDKPVKLGAAKRKTTAEGVDAALPKAKSKHLASTQPAPEVKPIKEVKEAKPAAKKAASKTAATKTPAVKKAAASKAVGKTVKVAPAKSEIAAVEALKKQPPKRVAKPKVAADAVPEKKVIKRVAKKAVDE